MSIIEFETKTAYKAKAEEKRIEADKLTVYTRELPGREGHFVDFPAAMDDRIREYLRHRGIDRLYLHQADAFSLAVSGHSLVITTSTASGKTLSFLLPVLQAILEDPRTRAIFVYPTKALAADQFRVITDVLAFFGEDTMAAGVYDGDTQPAERTRIRRSANIILTNPEMLNSAFLPNHSKYGFDLVFSNLKYIVVDELHSYRGAFGAHMANIFRRMRRICNYYHSSPQFLCSSATIANPLELAQTICGASFELVDRDGSPASARSYHILQPPEIRGSNDQVYGRIPAETVAAELIPQFVEEGRHFIAFGRSRRNVEVILKEARDKLDAAGFLGKGGSEKIAGYRGGYTPVERKQIERGMIQGDLLGLVSTNALELGIDIGNLDTTLLVGYPGTRASFWQQTGRCGRNQGKAENYLVLQNEPFDQYIALDPNWLFDQESEHAIVDPDNLLIQLAHVRAAAAEMPLALDDISLFPELGEILPVLMKAAEVKSLSGRFVWTGPAFPAGDYSLRNMDKSRYKMICGGVAVTEMDESQAFHELYPGAVYLHDGNLYEITRLDLVNRTAEGRPFTGNFYTVPAGEKDTRILKSHRSEKLGRTEYQFGDININDIVLMYKKLQFHNHQNLGYCDLTMPLQKAYDTESTWIRIPENVVRAYRKLLVRDPKGYHVRNNHFEGLSHAILNAAMMVTMTAKEDIDAVVSNNAVIPDADREESVSLFIYDRYEGGLGYSDKISDLMPGIIDRARRLVRGCPCKDGCPACVGDYTLDKKMVLWGLDNLWEESEAPESNKLFDTPAQTTTHKKFSFFKLPTELADSQWQELCKEVVRNGEAGGSFLQTIPSVRTEGHRLYLEVSSAFVADWLKAPENLRSIDNILRYHCICPSDMSIHIRTGSDDAWNLQHKLKEGKLRRHYEGILQPESGTTE